jgi:serine phosphatase RsbU (regulator of sigma subunit)
MGSYRHDRREGRPLTAMHVALATSLTTHFGDGSFATGVLARLDMQTGALTWTNAGHPLPLLIRNGQVVGELVCPPTPPWGTIARQPVVAEESLEPGDSVLLYTDGVIEAREPDGTEFGVDRLMDQATRHASDRLRSDTIIRLLIDSVRTHRHVDLDDDATIVLVRWDGPADAA